MKILVILCVFLVADCSAKDNNLNKVLIELKNEIFRSQTISLLNTKSSNSDYTLYYIVPDTICWRCTSSEFLGRWFAAGYPVSKALSKMLVIFTTGNKKTTPQDEYSQNLDSLPTITLPYNRKYKSLVGKVILSCNKDSKIISLYDIVKGDDFKQSYRKIDSILFHNYLNNQSKNSLQIQTIDTLHYLQNVKDLAVQFNENGSMSFYSNKSGKSWMSDSMGVKICQFDFRDIFRRYDKIDRLESIKYVFTSKNNGIFYYIRDYGAKDTIIDNQEGQIFTKNEGLIEDISINSENNTIKSKKIPLSEDRNIITIVKSTDDETVWLLNTVPPDKKKEQKTFYLWRYNRNSTIKKDEYEHVYEIFTDRTICATSKQLFLFSMYGKISRYTDGHVLEYEPSYYRGLGTRIITSKIGDIISIQETSDSLSYVVGYNTAGVRETEPIQVPKNSIAVFTKDLRSVLYLKKVIDFNKNTQWLLIKKGI
jgi:hypothetical protein